MYRLRHGWHFNRSENGLKKPRFEPPNGTTIKRENDHNTSLFIVLSVPGHTADENGR